MKTNNKRMAIFAVAIVLAAGALTARYYTVWRFSRMTPLMLAARAGDVAGVQRELRDGADPNRVWNESGIRLHGSLRKGFTPLHFALESAGPGEYSRARVVKPLLEAGADPCTSTRQGSPLLIAVDKRDLDVVRALWEHDHNGCLKAWSARAVSIGYEVLAQSPRDSDGWRLVEFLIDRVAQPGDADHPGALIAAPHPEAQAALERLVARGVRADGNSLVLASIHGKAELIPWLVEHGADVNAPVPGYVGEYPGPPLVRAAMNANKDGMAALIDAGADVNAVDEAGRTALAQVVCNTFCTRRPNPACERQLETARMLLERGARIEGADRNGRDVAACLRNRSTDPYRAELEALLGAR